MQPSGCIRLDVPQPASPFPIGAVILKRPFARPQRKPVSRPPFRGQRSRPTSSTSHRTFTESAPVRRSRAPHLPPLPFRVFDAPLAHSVRPVQPSGSPPSQVARFPFTPRGQTPLLMMTAADQRSEFASSREVRCFHEPLGTSSSCTQVKKESNRFSVFSSTELRIKINKI
jgi:hypothetical protein